MSFEEAALVEPLAVGVRAASRAGVRAGSTVLVCGAGAIGLTSLLASLALGATTVCITGAIHYTRKHNTREYLTCIFLSDLSPFRLSVARQIGATHTVPLNRTDSSHSIVAKSCDVINGMKFDCVIECSGAPASLQAAILVTHLLIYMYVVLVIHILFVT